MASRSPSMTTDRGTEFQEYLMVDSKVIRLIPLIQTRSDCQQSFNVIRLLNILITGRVTLS
jgi:hypothetical protein